MKKLLIMSICCIFLTGTASALQVKVLERVYLPSCSYYTVTTGEYLVFINLPELEKVDVKLLVGWNGLKENNSPLQWHDPKVVTATRKIGNTHVFSFQKSLISRGNPIRYNGFSFRFKVLHQDGQLSWLTGSSSQRTFYTIQSSVSNPPCFSEQKLPYRKAKLKIEASTR